MNSVAPTRPPAAVSRRNLGEPLFECPDAPLHSPASAPSIVGIPPSVPRDGSATVALPIVIAAIPVLIQHHQRPARSTAAHHRVARGSTLPPSRSGRHTLAGSSRRQVPWNESASSETRRCPGTRGQSPTRSLQCPPDVVENAHENFRFETARSFGGAVSWLSANGPLPLCWRVENLKVAELDSVRHLAPEPVLEFEFVLNDVVDQVVR